MSFQGLSYEFGQQMKAMIQDHANNNQAPMFGVIQDISEDKCYANIMVSGGVLKSVELFGYPVEGAKCIVIFIDGSTSTPVALCNPMSMRTYEDSYKTHNLLTNGSFEKYENGKFTNWTGGTKTDTAYYGSTGCKLAKGQNIVSDFVNIESIMNDEDNTVMVSWLWKGGAIKVEILDKNNKLIQLIPISLGITSENCNTVSEFRFHRLNFYKKDNKQIKVKISNTSNTDTYIDGVRVWTIDEDRCWYPSETDIKNGVGTEWHY